MPRQTTIGRLLVNDALPADLRSETRTLDGKGVAALMDEIARRHPDRYGEVARKLTDAGRDVAYTTGAFSFGLRDLLPSAEAQAARVKLQAEIDRLTRDDSMEESPKTEAIVRAIDAVQRGLADRVYAEARSRKSPLAEQVMSGARGKPMNLNSLIGFDGLYVDAKGRPVPLPILSSYAEGLRPAEYFAGAYGARKGVVDVKLATADAGYFGKQLAYLNHRLLVTADDDPEAGPDAEDRGLPSEVDDPDNEGGLLARAAGGYPRNTVLTPKVLRALRDAGVPKILVRSPTVGGPVEGGVYGRDLGIREKGGFAPRGDFAGIAAAQAIAEKVSQGSLCLDVSTLVMMADGFPRRIDQIEAGDLVLGYSLADKQPLPVRVVARHDNGERECVRIKTSLGSELVATEDHKVVQNLGHGYMRVAPLRDCVEGGNALLSVANPEKRADDGARFALIWAVPRRHEAVGLRATCDLEVDHPDHLFVLANGLIVSNSSKHSGGVAGAEKTVSGFQLVNALVQSPGTFPGGAAHAQRDGQVTAIEPAPQGGTYVTVGQQRHYVGGKLRPLVKVGDTVEAGDVLSEGTPIPGELVRHKGIGEGRRRFVSQFVSALRDGGIQAHRRNVELLARGLIDHVRLTDELGDHVPGDVVPYQTLERSWRPRQGAAELAPKRAVGQYLERPVLHYTIGTRVRPSMLQDLKDFGIERLTAHPEPPPFEPEFIRAAGSMEHDPDWMTRHIGANLKKPMLEGVARGATSDAAGTSYVPALAQRLDFGRQGLTQGWDPEDLKP